MVIISFLILAEELQHKQMLERFNLFADVTQDGKKYMTYSSFASCITNKEPGEKPSPVNEDLAVMFGFADANGDKLISLKEYSFFLTLLTSNAVELQTQFNVF